MQNERIKATESDHRFLLRSMALGCITTFCLVSFILLRMGANLITHSKEDEFQIESDLSDNTTSDSEIAESPTALIGAVTFAGGMFNFFRSSYNLYNQKKSIETENNMGNTSNFSIANKA